mmetsp:Transcript_22476/g.50193  ORF Transcript_22476/g.50193 Transcript_22476/m.50193 type:complete len:547 (-) Transcript_22476:895-2535(-)
MPGPHIDFHAAGPGGGWVGLVPYFRGKLGRFPVLDPRIVEAARQQARWIAGPGPDVVDGGVFHHVLVVFFLVGVPPFLPLDDRQGDGRVDHGGNDVDEGHTQDGRLEQARVLVHRGTNEQAPGRSSLAAQLVGGGDLCSFAFRGSEIPRHVDKIVKGVFLAQVLGPVRLLVPLASHLAAAPHVGDRVDHPPVQEGPAGRPEGVLDTGTVGPVPVQVGRDRGALSRYLIHDIGAVEEADRDVGGSVPGGDGDPLAPVLALVVAGDLLFLEDGPGAWIGRVRQGNPDVAERGDEGIVGHHHGIRVGVVVRPQPDVVGLLVELEPHKARDGRGVFSLVGKDPDPRQTPLAPGGNRVRPEVRDPIDGPLVAAVEERCCGRAFVAAALREDDVLPPLLRVGHRVAHHQAHVGRPADVCGDAPGPGAVAHAVQDLRAAPRHALERGIRIVQVQKVELRGFLRPGRNENVPAVHGLADSGREQLVVFPVEKLVVVVDFAAASDGSSVDPVGSLRLVLLDVEEGGLVGTPPDRPAALQVRVVVDDFTGGNVLDV